MDESDTKSSVLVFTGVPAEARVYSFIALQISMNFLLIGVIGFYPHLTL